MTALTTRSGASLERSIKDEARRLGFVLAGVTTPDPPPHFSEFEQWLQQGHHAGMGYLAAERARSRRGDPRKIMPDCRSILVLAAPYSNPSRPSVSDKCEAENGLSGRIAAYAWGEDYHEVFPERLKTIVKFIEQAVGHPISSRCYTDTGPILERDLAQRAGLGWIGKNTCLISPRHGSYFLLAEILLDLQLEPDPPFTTDHCGTCTRCIQSCPTQCIRADRTLDAGSCISYLTIELKDGIPPELRSSLGDWVFGCDVCQMVCPWNRFASLQGDPAFADKHLGQGIDLLAGLQMTPDAFSNQFRASPLRRARPRGYRRNLITALGNTGGTRGLATLRATAQDADPMIRDHAAWAISRISERGKRHEETSDHDQQ